MLEKTIKRLYKMFLRLIIVAQKRVKVINKVYLSKYKFRISDIVHYMIYQEYPGSLKNFPKIKIIGNNKSKFLQFEVNSDRYFWPKDEDMRGLAWIYQEVFVPASKNFHAYELGKVKVNPGDLVVDVGAGEGFFTRYALNKGAFVVSIEPVQLLAKALKKTFSQEIVSCKVKVKPYALGDTKKTLYLNLSKSNLCESYLGNDGIKVDVVLLDEILNEEKVSFIKMDVEGAEIDVINGAREIIAKYKPKLAIAVYHRVENANLISDILRNIRPDYNLTHKGIYSWNDCEPRPFMVYAW